MSLKKSIGTLFCVLLNGMALSTVTAQPQLKFSGFVSEMPVNTYSVVDDSSTFNNMLHSRLGIYLTTNPYVNMGCQMRLRYFQGETFRIIPNFDKLTDFDPGWTDLSYNLSSTSQSVVNLNFDRLWFEYATPDIRFRLGRQRINWSIGEIWSANDIFNTYSYFDFDYAERPGIDALRMQWFYKANRFFEGVVKIDYRSRISAVGFYKTIVNRHLFQVLGGYYDSREYLLGTGWSGFVGRTKTFFETTYFTGIETSDACWIVDLGSELFCGRWMKLKTDILYSSNLKDETYNFNKLIYRDYSVKNMSISDISVNFTLSGYNIKYFRPSLSYLYYPHLDAYTLGTAFDFSFKNNIYFSVSVQDFVNQSGSNNINNCISYLKLKVFF